MGSDLVVQGLTTGSVYILAGLSINVLYRPTNTFNFAQGDLMMLGALISAAVLTIPGMPWIAACAIAMAAVAMLAIGEYEIAVAPFLRRSNSSGWIISTLAFAMVIEDVVGKLFGADPRPLPPPRPLSTMMDNVLGLRVSSYQLALWALTLVLLGITELGYRSRAGMAILAIAEDRDASLLRGIRPGRLSRISFLIAGALAAFGGVLAAPRLYASTALGPMLLIKGFEVVAVGGVGSNYGALIAGCLIGLAEALGAALLSPGYQDAATFAVVLVLLLIRPQGLFGSPFARQV